MMFREAQASGGFNMWLYDYILEYFSRFSAQKIRASPTGWPRDERKSFFCGSIKAKTQSLLNLFND